MSDKSGRRFIFYHDDADGRCAAALAGRAAIAAGFANVVYLPVDYGARAPDPEQWMFHPDHDDVWLVDFAFDLIEMLEFRDKCCGRLHWFDHHITSLERLEAVSDLPGLRKDGVAACMLVWEWLFPKMLAPWGVRFIADRDVWSFKYGDATRHFYESYIALDDTGPEARFWDHCCTVANPDVDFDIYPQWVAQMLAHGAQLRSARINQLRFTARYLGRKICLNVHGYDGRVKSYSALVLNYPGSGDLGEVVGDLGYDVAWCYVNRVVDGQVVWKHSLYSKKVDVAALCKLAGGGGHKGAVGFTESILSVPGDRGEVDFFLSLSNAAVAHE